MIVTLTDIGDQFDALLSGTRSREDVETWADRHMRAEDEGRLVYEPKSDEARIWDAITYLSGVALRTAPAVYLHAPEDFLAYRRVAGL